MENIVKGKPALEHITPEEITRWIADREGKSNRLPFLWRSRTSAHSRGTGFWKAKLVMQKAADADRYPNRVSEARRILRDKLFKVCRAEAERRVEEAKLQAEKAAREEAERKRAEELAKAELANERAVLANQRADLAEQSLRDRQRVDEARQALEENFRNHMRNAGTLAEVDIRTEQILSA